MTCYIESLGNYGGPSYASEGRRGRAHRLVRWPESPGTSGLRGGISHRVNYALTRSNRVAIYTILAMAFLSLPAQANGLPVVGEGTNQQLDATQFPQDQKARYEVFRVKCTKCHPMSRPIQALRTHTTPVTGSPFNAEFVKKYVVRMMRKPNSGMDREDAKEVIIFLDYALTLTSSTN